MVTSDPEDYQIQHKKVLVNGVEIFYREAGNKENPSILLLHGFPTSSLMFKNLMTALSGTYHFIAPDYPGFGFSSFPSRKIFDYSFENIASYITEFTEQIKLNSFSIYLHDYGCSVGLRICMKHPERIAKIIVQNGNSYNEGLGPQWDDTIDYWENPVPGKKKKVAAFLSKEGIKKQYYAGLTPEFVERVSPENWIIDWERMKRPGNIEMQFTLNVTYQTNIEMFPLFQEYFRTYQPPALVLWGKYDVFFDVAEAFCYKRDLPEAQIFIIEGGHMLLETNFTEVIVHLKNFMSPLPPERS